MNLGSIIREEHKRLEAIKDKLMRDILWLPDNPNITRLGPMGFTMQAGMLDSFASWSPEYYDFQWQYDKLAEIVCHTEMSNLISKLEKIIKEGYYRQDNWRIKFHPVVLANLKNLLEA